MFKENLLEARLLRSLIFWIRCFCGLDLSLCTWRKRCVCVIDGITMEVGLFVLLIKRLGDLCSYMREEAPF